MSEIDWEHYDSGPFCRHWSAPWECEQRCAGCGHTCARHPAGRCEAAGCDCAQFVEGGEAPGGAAGA